MTTDELIEYLKDRRRDASADVAESKDAPNSYGAGYDRGYLTAIEEILKLTADLEPRLKLVKSDG